MNTGFQPANKRIDEIKIELKDLIKCYDAEGKDRVHGVEDDFGKVPGRVGNVEGKVDTVEHSMYHFMEVALDKQSREIWVTVAIVHMLIECIEYAVD